MTGFKLFRRRKDGSLGPLFINRRLKLFVGQTYTAESHPTKGFAFRPGFHICSRPVAPHLSKKGRVWAKVEFGHRETLHRPKSQGGTWYLGHWMKVLKIL